MFLQNKNIDQTLVGHTIFQKSYECILLWFPFWYILRAQHFASQNVSNCFLQAIVFCKQLFFASNCFLQAIVFCKQKTRTPKWILASNRTFCQAVLHVKCKQNAPIILHIFFFLKIVLLFLIHFACKI